MSIVNAVCPVVEIKGAAYEVEAIAPGFAGVAAVRVTKLINGESYDLVRTFDNRLECSCPDFVCRHADKGTCCKHLTSAVALGYLPAPVSGGSPVAVASAPVPAAVAPITRADLARAKMFGLKLPADAPRAFEVESPAPKGVASSDGPSAPAPVVEQGCKSDLHPSARPKGVHNLDTLPAPTSEAVPVKGGLTTGTPLPDLPEFAYQGQAHRVVAEVLAGRGPVWTVEAKRGEAWEPALSLDDRAEAIEVAKAADLDPDLNPTVSVLDTVDEAPRPAPRRFAPTWEEVQQAMALFGPLTTEYQAEGQSAPPLGDRSYPRRKPARVERPTGIRDEDIYSAGATS